MHLRKKSGKDKNISAQLHALLSSIVQPAVVRTLCHSVSQNPTRSDQSQKLIVLWANQIVMHTGKRHEAREKVSEQGTIGICSTSYWTTKWREVF